MLDVVTGDSAMARFLSRFVVAVFEFMRAENYQIVFMRHD
jgi:hypothetical protein